MLEAKSSFGSTLVVLSSKLVASNFSTSLILASLAIVFSFTAIAGMQEAFADSSPGLPQTLHVQNVHYREMGESLSVASTFGSPGASGQSFTRAISDSVGVTTGFTPPQSQASRAPVDNTSYRSSQPYQGPSQRTEERLNLKNLANTKADSISGKGYGGGTPTNVSSEYRTGDSVNVSPPSEEIQLVADSGGNSDEDSNSLCILEYCIHLENYGFQFLVDNLPLDSAIYGKNTIDIIVSGTMIAVVLAPLASRGSKTEPLFVVAFRLAKASGKALDRRWIQAILMILILFLAVPSNFYLPPAYGSTVKFGKVVGNHATDTFVADTNVPSNTVIATYTRSDTGSTVYTVTKADLDQSLTGNVGNTVTITFTFVQVITSSTGAQYQFMSWTLGGSGWGATTDGRCQTNVVYTTLTDSCKSTNNGGGNTGGPVATYGFRASPSDTLNVSPALSGSKSKGGSPSTTLAVTDSISAKIRKRVISVDVGVADSITIRITRSIFDSITIADSITSNKSIAGSTQDTAALSDNIGRTYLATRTRSDSVAVTDSIATMVAASRSASDSVAVADSIGVTKVFAKSIPDSLTIEDSVSAAVGRAKPVADSVTLSDSITTSYHASRTASDSLAVTDNVNVESGAKVDIPDTLGTSDSAARQLSASRSISDSVAITDSITHQLSASRSISDSVAITDSITHQLSASRSISDSVAVAATISRSPSRSISDSVAVADSITATYIASRSISDSLAVAASIAAVPNYASSASDAVTLSDSIAMAVTRGIAESIDLADTPTTSHGTSRAAADSVSLSDDIAMKVSRSLSESIQLDSNVSNGVPGSADDDVVLADDIAFAVTKQRADSIEVDDAISINITRMIQDEIGLTDEARKLASIVINDSIQVADSASKQVIKLVSDSVGVASAVAMHVSRSLGDELTIEESASRSISRTISDTISADDSIAVSPSRGATDSVELDDAISKSITKQTAETLDLDDAVSVNVSRSLSEDLAVADNASASPSRQNEETIGISDAISKSVVKAVDDSVAITESVTAKITGIALSDNVSISDEISNPGIPLNDSISLADNIAVTINWLREIADSVTVSEKLFLPPEPKELISVEDSISVGLYRNVDDSVEVADEVKAGRLILIDDSLQVVASLTNVAWSRTLTLDEPLGLGTEVCLPGVCATNHLVSHSLGMHDSVELVIIPPPELNEEVAVADQISVGKRVSPVPPIAESLSITESVTARLVGILVVESKDKVGPMPSLPVTGTFTYTGNAADLKNAVIPVPIPINSTVVKPNLPNQVTVLRTYSVPIGSTPDIPTNNVIMSESQMEVPAYSNMFMRLNFNETPSLAGKKDFISMLDIEFTPKVDSTDFGLVVAVTDKPAPAPTPVEDLKPVYLDVRWWGNFPGVENPTVSDYYQNPPKFTFTVNDQWVADNDAARDAQGWPALKLWLLNENTNQWQQITAITKVSSGGGSYTFSATLPHFSNYAITANVASAAPAPGQGPIIIEPPVVPPSSFAVQLADTLETHEGTTMSAITIIEEFLQPKKVSVFLSDLVTVTTKPVSLPKEIKVDDVTIKVAVDEIKQTQLTGPAVAEITVQITNEGEDMKEFELEFTYTDNKGELHRQTVVLEVDGKSTLTKQIELPFADPGTYVVTAEVRNVPEGDTVGYSELVITIPWYPVYMYALLGVAGAILGISGIAMALYLLKKPVVPMFAAVAGGAIAALYWRRPKVRLFAMDEEEFKKDHRYEVLGRLTLREVVPTRSEFKAVFTLDVWSKNDGREFVVTYRAINELGEVVHESHILVPAMSGLQSLSVVMPFGSSGNYAIQAEARNQLEGDVLDKATLPVKIDPQ